MSVVFTFLCGALHSGGECHHREGTYDEKGSDTNEIGGHAPSVVPDSKSPDMHAPLVRLHRAIATRRQARITGSGME